MSGWRIQPSGVADVVKNVRVSASDFAKATAAVDPEVNSAMGAFGSQPECLLGDVAAALQGVLSQESDRVTRIATRITACELGVVQATDQYQAGQAEMAAATQRQAVGAASTGDLSFWKGEG